MTKNFFYSYLIKLETLETHLVRFELEEKHHQELLHLAHQTVHAEVMSFVIGELPDKHKHEFLKQFSRRPQDKGLLIFLKNSIDDFETEVKNISREVEQKLIHELQDYEDASVEWLGGA